MQRVQRQAQNILSRGTAKDVCLLASNPTDVKRLFFQVVEGLLRWALYCYIQKSASPFMIDHALDLLKVLCPSSPSLTTFSAGSHLRAAFISESCTWSSVI